MPLAAPIVARATHPAAHRPSTLQARQPQRAVVQPIPRAAAQQSSQTTLQARQLQHAATAAQPIRRPPAQQALDAFLEPKREENNLQRAPPATKKMRLAPAQPPIPQPEPPRPKGDKLESRKLPHDFVPFQPALEHRSPQVRTYWPPLVPSPVRLPWLPLPVSLPCATSQLRASRADLHDLVEGFIETRTKLTERINTVKQRRNLRRKAAKLINKKRIEARAARHSNKPGPLRLAAEQQMDNEIRAQVDAKTAEDKRSKEMADRFLPFLANTIVYAVQTKLFGLPKSIRRKLFRRFESMNSTWRYVRFHLHVAEQHWRKPKGVVSVVRCLVDPEYDPRKEDSLPPMDKFVPELLALEKQREMTRRFPLEDLAGLAKRMNVDVGNNKSDVEMEEKLPGPGPRNPALDMKGALQEHFGEELLHHEDESRPEDPLEMTIDRSAAPRAHYIKHNHSFVRRRSAPVFILAARMFWSDGYDRPDSAPLSHQAAKVWNAFLMASGRSTARFMPALSQRQLHVIFVLFSKIDEHWEGIHAEIQPPEEIAVIVEKLLAHPTVQKIPENTLPRQLEALRRVAKVARVRSLAVFKLEGDDFLSTLVTMYREMEPLKETIETDFSLSKEDLICKGHNAVRSMLHDSRSVKKEEENEMKKIVKKEVKKEEEEKMEVDDLIDLTEESDEKVKHEHGVKKEESEAGPDPNRKEILQLVEDRLGKCDMESLAVVADDLLETMRSMTSEKVPMPADFDWSIHQIVQMSPEFAQRYAHEKVERLEIQKGEPWEEMRRKIKNELSDWDERKNWTTAVGGEFVKDFLELNPMFGEKWRVRNARVAAPTTRRRTKSISETSSASPSSVDWTLSLSVPDYPLTKTCRHPIWVSRAVNHAINFGYQPKPVVDIWDPKLHDDNDNDLVVGEWKMTVNAHSNAELSEKLARHCSEWHYQRMGALINRTTEIKGGRRHFIEGEVNSDILSDVLPPPDFSEADFMPLRFFDWRACLPDWIDSDPNAKCRYVLLCRKQWRRDYPTLMPIREKPDQNMLLKYKNVARRYEDFRRRRRDIPAVMIDALDGLTPELCVIEKREDSPPDPRVPSGSGIKK